ncbi:DUF3192 domain-containing protein [Ningiella sp. W23]|uniref:DUF3192 domain-containing protein n=1 Tax=Ningiella sp. W23 TaxID=3023715 RepID=UPI0037584772
MNKTKNFAMSAIVIATAFSLSACVISIDDDGFDSDFAGHHYSSWQKEQKANREHVSNLSLGASKQSITDKMGPAAFNEALKQGDKEYQLLWYRTQHRENDGITTKDECTPLVFMNNELIGWGETALSHL